MLVYIHGFNSSPASTKARQLAARLDAMGRSAQFACPALPDRPCAAIDVLEALVAGQRRAQITLVGSSLGGYYATWLAEKHGLRAVLVNPAITPHEGLRAYLGPQRNLYTGEAYELTEQHLRELATLFVPRPTRLDRYYLMVTTGDEVLDYREAVAKYAGAKQLVVQGSDHGFAEFEQYLDSVLRFAGIS
ncbi:MAG TPA: YqiA/YcfP family alpha/beta fold hydrolase [Burkholderiales bacterium]|nr:YqiA/YcfP family alpha/beta fold hydrolase [Burkholderiales bacterium]